MAEKTGHRVTRSSSLLSFDAVRIAAILLVALQHLLSVSDIKTPEIMGLLYIGQLGVSALCGLSGYFSMRSSRTDNLQWIKGRVKRILLPYWILLIPIFMADAITHYKPMTLGLIVSQFLGIGLFTHAKSLVGVHLWFITLVLVCYGMAVIIRWKRRSLPLFVVFTVLAIHWNPLFSAHMVSFLSGCVLSEVHRFRNRLWVGTGISILCFVGIEVSYAYLAYPLAATLVVVSCTAFSRNSSEWLTFVSASTYEFYLVHGPIYLGLAKYMGLDPLTNLLVGTMLAGMAAVLLQKASSTTLNLGKFLWKQT